MVLADVGGGKEEDESIPSPSLGIPTRNRQDPGRNERSDEV